MDRIATLAQIPITILKNIINSKRLHDQLINVLVASVEKIARFSCEVKSSDISNSQLATH